jgi:hypothetical protein
MARPKEHLIRLWDGLAWLGRWVDGFPAFGFRWAPSGLATRRQLRATGLCPGGQEPYALLLWRQGRRFAYLYRLDLARPKRVSTARQRTALDRAMARRRRCRTCGQDAGYCVPTSTQQCWTCWSAENPSDQALNSSTVSAA